MVAGAAAPAHAQVPCADHGVPVGGAPNWRERGVLVLSNAVRAAPIDYRNQYIGNFPNVLVIYPPQPPLRWNVALGQAARAHSTDMATNFCFQHNSCDGTAWAARIQSYTGSTCGVVGENIGAFHPTPLAVTNLWLRDEVSPGVPAADGTTDGHRANIMNGTFQDIGIGHAFNLASPFDHYWTQDFAYDCPPPNSFACGPLADGTAIRRSATQLEFLANYWATPGAAPTQSTVVIDGVPHAMAPYLGTTARGTYRAVLPPSGACRSFYFLFRDAAGGVWRYPARGHLRTGGDTPCDETYLAGCPADFNGSGTATTSDITAFLGAWFGDLAGGTVVADFDLSGTVTSADISAFLGAWFGALAGGC
ncbi:MAG TPA: CAP domain-containing protein [Phycisphaerales bacterium]|nr:CAP domain-containing protein [Phycisphaerales bacterium]